MLGKWERKSLHAGSIVGAMLFMSSLVDPGTRTSFYQKLFGIILLLGCVGMIVQKTVLSSKKDEDDRFDDPEC